jgi:hypothetical protein
VERAWTAESCSGCARALDGRDRRAVPAAGEAGTRGRARRRPMTVHGPHRPAGSRPSAGESRPPPGERRGRAERRARELVLDPVDRQVHAFSLRSDRTRATSTGSIFFRYQVEARASSARASRRSRRDRRRGRRGAHDCGPRRRRRAAGRTRRADGAETARIVYAWGCGCRPRRTRRGDPSASRPRGRGAKRVGREELLDGLDRSPPAPAERRSRRARSAGPGGRLSGSRRPRSRRGCRRGVPGCGISASPTRRAAAERLGCVHEIGDPDSGADRERRTVLFCPSRAGAPQQENPFGRSRHGRQLRHEIVPPPMTVTPSPCRRRQPPPRGSGE